MENIILISVGGGIEVKDHKGKRIFFQWSDFPGVRKIPTTYEKSYLVLKSEFQALGFNLLKP